MRRISKTPPPSDSVSDRNVRSRLPAWKKSLFALACLISFLACLELFLAAVGVRPITYSEDPYVGFSSSTPLFVEQKIGTDVQLVTAPNKLPWFNPQHFSRSKRDGVYRIFCVGGSTTYGRPYDDSTSYSAWIREFLADADTSREWEVINAGGVSYASYRVARLMEELVRYEPDLFIVYSGHNEFLERRTYAEFFDSPSTLRRIGGPLRRTRIFTAMRSMLTGRSASNLPDLQRSELPMEVSTVLDNSVGPEAYARDDDGARHILDHFRFNLHRMIQIARSVGAETILVTPACNLKDSSPFKSQQSEVTTLAEVASFHRLLAKARESFARPDGATALAALNEALVIDNRVAEAHFLRGRILLSLNRPVEAKAAFRRARDEDVCPLRATSSAINTVREVAKEEQVPLIDFVKITEEASEYGIPGSKLFLDHVHPTISGHQMLAEHLMSAMVDAQIVRPARSWTAESIKRIAARIHSRVDDRMQGIALRNLAKVLGWAGKVDEAERLAKQAVELVPDDAETQFEAGVSAEDRDDLTAAVAHYGRAKELAPEMIPAWINLGVALARQGRLDDAEQVLLEGLAIDPESGVLCANLARVTSLKGDLDEAIRYQRKAVALAPPERVAELKATLREYEQQRIATTRRPAL